MKAAAVALICVFSAACSTAGGKLIAQSGTYRTGAVGTALSNAAGRGPSELARVQNRLRPEARRTPAQGDRTQAAAAPARSAARDEPRRAARPASLTAREAFGAQTARSVSTAAAPRPAPELGPIQPGRLAERALTNQTILAPALAESGGVSAGPVRAAAPVNRALAGWSLSRPQLGVLALGLLLATVAALIAAWSAARRRRMLAEPRIASPVPANDVGRPEPAPTRATGPQYVLPLSPAGAPPRTYSMKTGGTAKLTSAPGR